MSKVKELNGVLITVGEINKIEKKTVKITDYHDWYPLLNCDLIDIVTRQIGKNYYDIVCDDEGLFKEPLIPACLNFNEEGHPEEIINGNVFICGLADDNGDLTSLTEEGIEEILKNIVTVWYKDMIQIVIKTKF